MKAIGILMLIVGLIGLVGSCSIDTTVSSGADGRRVHNIGKMNEQQNLLIIFAAIAIVGSIFATRSGKNSIPSNTDAPTYETRKCTYCAEDIRIEATVCRFCGKDCTQSTVSLSNHLMVSSNNLRPSFKTAEDCIQALTALDYKVSVKSENSWQIKSPSGSSILYAHSIDDLRGFLVQIQQRVNSKI
jgi:hypothetical protein